MKSSFTLAKSVTARCFSSISVPRSSSPMQSVDRSDLHSPEAMRLADANEMAVGAFLR